VGTKRKKRVVNPASSTASASASAAADSSCVLETGYYLNPKEPCETHSQFGRLPTLNTEGWSVVCVAPGRLSDAFGVSSELEDMTTMFVDKTAKYDILTRVAEIRYETTTILHLKTDSKQPMLSIAHSN